MLLMMTVHSSGILVKISPLTIGNRQNLQVIHEEERASELEVDFDIDDYELQITITHKAPS